MTHGSKHYPRAPRPANPCMHAEGTVRLPGSKSISNRTLLLAALSEGTHHASHDLLASDDTLVMLGALRSLGIEWEQIDERTHVVHGARRRAAEP